MALTRLVFSLLVTIITSSASTSSSFSFSLYNRSSSSSSVPNAAHPSFNSAAAVAEYSPCNSQEPASAAPSSLKLHLNHHHPHRINSSRKHAFLSSAHKDGLRIQSLFGRIAKKATSRKQEHGHVDVIESAAAAAELAGKKLMATLESGVSLGSGEYFMDVFVGTPPKHFSLILDTGSDLNWIQCSPCHDCFHQHGPLYDPRLSSTYRNLTCDDARCGLVSSPDSTRPRPCRRRRAAAAAAADDDDASCPYFYWYGDQSNTTGDLAVEAFTVNLTRSGGDGPPGESHRVEGVVFGCGHWNRGLFHGAAGLLGLGRGPLSFASQLRSLYGHTFSYCLVDRNSDLSVSSKLIFGEDQSLLSHPALNYTSFAAGRDNPDDDTFYYVHVRGIRVGGDLLPIAQESWELAKDGAGGTIIDSGTTLSYFVDPAYRAIRDAFLKKVKYPVLEDFPVLNPCYNVSGVEDVQMPEFSVEFVDGAVWDFPVDNYFIRLEPEDIMCLAILGTPRSSLSIIGNYQQQNFHILYDTNKSRLGFAPMRCAEV